MVIPQRHHGLEWFVLFRAGFAAVNLAAIGGLLRHNDARFLLAAVSRPLAGYSL